MVYSKSFATRVLREHVQRTYARINFREPWRNLPEIPTSEEILQDVSWQDVEAPEQPLDYQKLAEPKEFDPRLPYNNIDGAWDSKEEYLGFHYRILREDAVAPLRQSVAEFKKKDEMGDTQDTNVYTDVCCAKMQWLATYLLTLLGPPRGSTIESSRCSFPDRILNRQSRKTNSVGTIKATYPR